ncbi:MAG: RusA family crossover junction endodeoxyribonuclease [Oscillospiraceae bacterium]|jgi:Holliday junction resolvase RusA-like endonuclease|nr:RusA family crossover junction endodeoxyribonuclease [Oscillospiraceae bacterium]
MKISFTILGIPQGKERPRFTRFGKAYTPPKTKFYEETVRANYKRLIRHKFSENAPLISEITAFYKIPKSASKKLQKKMLNGEIKPTVKPDGDNVIKIILDALNGVAFYDDAQVCKILFEKKHGEMPKVCVKIEDLEITEGGKKDAAL